MKKNCILMTLFLLSVLLFCGCKDSESANSNNDLTPTVAEPLYPSSHTVTFARFMAPSVSRESQNEINRILYEKGLDCQIVFVETDLTGKDYAEWLNMQEIENNNPIDIITDHCMRNAVDDRLFRKNTFRRRCMGTVRKRLHQSEQQNKKG